MKQMVRNWKALEELGDSPKETIEELEEKKLDKVKTETAYSQVYGKETNGNQRMYNVATLNVEQTLIYRDANGRAKINEPSADKDIANKKYVDDAIKPIYWHTIHFKRSGEAIGFAEGYMIILNNSSQLINRDDFLALLRTEGFTGVVINGLTSGSATGTYGTLNLYLITYKSSNTFTIHYYDNTNHVIATNDYTIDNFTVEDLGANKIN